MAGLFGLFGRKNNNSDESYYLSPDESKTFGDIDYMRKSKTVRRTFAKSVSGGGGESVNEVSSLKMNKRTGFSNQSQSGGFSSSSFNSTSSYTPTPTTPAPTPSTPTTPVATTPAPTPSTSSSNFSSSTKKRSKNDSGMDMFRNMAKNIKKG